MPLTELASGSRSAGINSVLRHIARGEVVKVFLAEDADEKFCRQVREAAEKMEVPVETAENSIQLGRACALMRKTSVAALLKK